MKLLRVITILALITMLPAVALGGKKDEARIQELEEKVAALEAELSERMIAMEALVDQKIEAAVQEFANREQNALEALQEISGLVSKGEHKEAKGKMEEFGSKYAGTDAARKAASMARELEVIGKKAPDSFEVLKWFAGEGGVTGLDGEGTTLVVFWEEWCPHCKREVPKTQATFDNLHPEGLNVIALTSVTKSSTDEKVADFVEKNSLTFPIAKEQGQIKSYFNVGGIPAAAVVKDGEIVWRGHPARLSETILRKWL
jgi:thiol-disulfide isomerase/thioredoxin